MKEPRLKYKVDFLDLDMTINSVEIWNQKNLKKGDIVNIVDSKEKLRAKCRVKDIINVDEMNDKIELEILKQKKNK